MASEAKDRGNGYDSIPASDHTYDQYVTVRSDQPQGVPLPATARPDPLELIDAAAEHCGRTYATGYREDFSIDPKPIGRGAFGEVFSVQGSWSLYGKHERHMAVKKATAGEDAEALKTLQKMFKDMNLPDMVTTTPTVDDSDQVRPDHRLNNQKIIKRLLKERQENLHRLHLIAFRNFLDGSAAIKVKDSEVIVMPRLYPLSIIPKAQPASNAASPLEEAYRSLVSLVRIINENGYCHRDLHKGNILVYQDPLKTLADWDAETPGFIATDYFAIIPIDFGLMCRVGDPIKIINVNLATDHGRGRKVCNRCDVKALLLLKRDLLGADSVSDELLKRSESCDVSFDEI